MPKESSIVSTNLEKSEILNETEHAEQMFYSEVNKCKHLEKEIMEKIETYRQKAYEVYKMKKELMPKADIISLKNIMNQSFLTDDTFKMISNLDEAEHIELKENSLSDADDFVKNESSTVNNESSTVKNELKKYCDYVQEVIGELAVEQLDSIESSQPLKMKFELLKENRRQALESKSREITETVLHALESMGAEHKILTQYCPETMKKNEECNEKLREKLVW